MPSPPRSSSALLRILIRATGVDPDELVEVARLTPDQVAGGDIAYGDGMRIWQALQAMTADPIVGHTIGAGLKLHHVGVFGPVLAHAEDVRAGLGAACRAFELALPAGSLTTHDVDEGFEVRYVRPDFPVHVRHGVESLFATLVGLTRQAAHHELSLAAVDLRSASPPDSGVFDTFYGRPVRFAQDVDRVVFAASSLGLPMVGSEPELSRVVAERAAALLRVGSFEERAVEACRDAIEAGGATLALTAKQLGMSERSLQRRLAGEDVTFRHVRDAAAREIAERLLRDERASIDEVAEKLGYSSRAAFERAFRRWHGATPAAWRRERS